jgi:hypothetical protein
MPSRLAARLNKLEHALGIARRTGSGHLNCHCGDRPEFAVTVCRRTRTPTEHQLAEEAKLLFACPVHGAVGPRTWVRVRSFGLGCEDECCRSDP